MPLFSHSHAHYCGPWSTPGKYTGCPNNSGGPKQPVNFPGFPGTAFKITQRPLSCIQRPLSCIQSPLNCIHACSTLIPFIRTFHVVGLDAYLVPCVVSVPLPSQPYPLWTFVQSAAYMPAIFLHSCLYIHSFTSQSLCHYIALQWQRAPPLPQPLPFLVFLV